MQLQSVMQSTRQQLEPWMAENLNPTQEYHLLSCCRGPHWGLPTDTSHGRILLYPVSTSLRYDRFSSCPLRPHACQLPTANKWTVLWREKIKGEIQLQTARSETATVEVCRAAMHPGTRVCYYSLHQEGQSTRTVTYKVSIKHYAPLSSTK